MTNLSDTNKQGVSVLINFLSKEYFSYSDLFVSIVNVGKTLLNADFGIICSRQDNTINFLYATENNYFKSKTTIPDSEFNSYNIFLPQNETIAAEIRIRPGIIRESQLNIKEKLSYIAAPVFLLNKVFAYLIIFKSGGFFTDNDYVILGNLSMFLSSQTDKLTSFKKYLDVKNSAKPEENPGKSVNNVFLYLSDRSNKNFIFIKNNIFGYLGFDFPVLENETDFNSNILNIMHPDDAGFFKIRAEELNELKPENLAECRYRLKDSAGEWRFFYHRDIVYYFDNTGKSSEYLGIILELNEKHIDSGEDEDITRFIKNNSINLKNNGMEKFNDDLLDFNIIQNLKDLGGEGDPGFLKEVIQLYLEQAPGLISDIKNSYLEKNSQKLSQSSHALKGASLNIGAKKFAEICRKLEFKGKENDLSDIDELFKEFEENFNVTSSELIKIIQ